MMGAAHMAELPPRFHAVRATVVYGICHLLVDLACVSTVVGTALPALGVEGVGARALAVALYDMVAFCLQLPLGALLDVVGRRHARAAALVSFALVAVGVLAPRVPQLAALEMPVLGSVGVPVLLVAVGNALFHCVGGIEVIGESEGKVGPAGAFISTGAVGVFVGSMSLVNAWRWMPEVLAGLLAACALMVLCLGKLSDEQGVLAVGLSGRGWAALLLLAATVALRSYAGLTMGFPWKEGLALGACVVGAVVAGKAVGGFVADGMGLALTSFVSLGGAAACFWYSWESMPAGLAGAFLFNFTMAITLGALARLLPRASGLAFGVASFSLALGALPALMGLRMESALALCVLSIASLVLLELGLLLLHRETRP